MKVFYPFLFCLLFTSAAFGQNNLFIPFGQSAEEVKDFLGSRDYIINIHEDLEMQSVRAVLDQDKQVEYVFKEGSLYAITVTRNYRDRKIGRDILRNCLDYMEYVSKGQMKQTDQDGIICHTAFTESKVMKLFVQQHVESVTITLTSMSRKHGPTLSEEEFFYEEKLLQRHYISN